MPSLAVTRQFITPILVSIFIYVEWDFSVSAILAADALTYLPAFLPTCLPTCLPAYLPIQGGFNGELGIKYRNTISGMGNSIAPRDICKNSRGQEPPTEG